MSGPLLCRNDTKCRRESGDICTCRRHVADCRRHFELSYFLLHNDVQYLIINQITRVSNGTLKMAILHEICKHRRTTLIISIQYGVSPTTISEADQHHIEYRKGILSNFHATIAMLSYDSSKFFQSILRKAWNEHGQLPAHHRCNCP